MATKNFAANLKIGAVMGSSVGRVFGALKTKLKDQENTLKGLRAAYKQAEKGTGEYAGKLDQLKHKIDAAEKELRRLKAAANFDIGKSLRGVGSTFLGDFKRLGAVAGIATGAVLGTGAAVYHVTKGFIDWADDIGDSSEALGISTQALQTWQFAAATVGVDGAKMTASIAKYSKAIMEGGKATNATLAKLGINAARIKKLSLDDQLKVTAEAFKRYKGLDKTALAMKLFGKSGYQLTGILSKGADGFDEFRKMGEETGAVLTDEAAKAAGDTATALDKFGITMTGLRNTIAIQFVPALGRMADKFTQLIRDNGPKIKLWATQFAEVLETKVVPAIGQMIDRMPAFLDQLGTLASRFWTVLSSVQEFLGGWDRLGYVLLAANFAPTLVAIGSLAKGLWGLAAASWAATGPIGLIVVATLALGAAAIYLWTHLDEVGQWFLDTFPNAMEKFGQWLVKGEEWLITFGEAFKVWSAITVEATIKVWNAGKAMFEGIWNSGKVVIDNLKAGFDSFFTWITSKFDAIGEKITTMWDRAKKLGESIKGFFSFGGAEGAANVPVTPLTPSDGMPAQASTGTQNNNVNIHVNTPAQNGAQFGRELRQEIQRKPLFDMSGALVPG